MRLHHFAAAALALAIIATPAIAQTTGTDTDVDISPVTNTIIDIIGIVLTAIVSWIGWHLKNLIASKVDLSETQLDEQLQQMFNEAAARSIAYAGTVIKDKLPTKIDSSHPFIVTAAGYLMKGWPELLARTGMTPEKIRDAILARLPGDMTAPADAIVLAKASGTGTTAPQ